MYLRHPFIVRAVYGYAVATPSLPGRPDVCLLLISDEQQWQPRLQQWHHQSRAVSCCFSNMTMMTTFEKSQRQSRCSWSTNRSAGVPVLSPFVTARSLPFSTISSGGTVIFLTAHVTSLCSSLGRRRRRLHMTTIQLLLLLLRIIQCFYYNCSCY